MSIWGWTGLGSLVLTGIGSMQFGYEREWDLVDPGPIKKYWDLPDPDPSTTQIAWILTQLELGTPDQPPLLHLEHLHPCMDAA